MSLELLQELNDNYHIALAFHREVSDSFFFVGLFGFSAWHDYQYMEEHLTQRKIKQYITHTYGSIVPDILPKGANIVNPLLNGVNRKSIKMDTNWKLTKDIFGIYLDFETNNFKKYQQISTELFNNGEKSASVFVDGIASDVKAELDYLNDLIISYNAMDWDMPTIVDKQEDFYERFEYLIKNLLGKSEQLHHWNGAYDPRSRVLFKKSPED